MLTVLVVVLLVFGIAYWLHKNNQPVFTRPVHKIETVVKDVVDINNDGKVDVKDAVAAVKKIEETGKKVGKKVAKTAAKITSKKKGK